MGPYVQNLYSLFLLRSTLTIKVLSITLLAYTLMGCNPNKSHRTIPPTNPEDLTAKGDANELEKVLENILKMNDKTVLSAKECPQKAIQDLPSDVIQNIECGAIKVPEDHRSDSKKFLSLGYLKFPRSFDTQKPLLIIEQGGPGGSSILLSSSYLEQIKQLKQNFNILAIEQRGTLWTRPKATCDVIVDEIIRTLEENLNSEDAEKSKIHTNQKCLESIKNNLNVAKISSYQISKDIVYSAHQFGFSKFSYFGVSYGTLVGQYLLKYSPNSVEKMVLDSPAIPGWLWLNDAYKSLDSVGKRNFEDYISTQMRDVSFNEAVKKINSAVKIFKDNPISIKPLINGKSVRMEMNGNTYLGLLLKVLVYSYDKKSLEYLLWTSDNIKTQPDKAKKVLSLYVEAIADPTDDITQIMYQSIICREFPTHTEDIKAATATWKFLPLIIGKETLDQMENSNRCYLNIPRSDEDLILQGPISSDKPVLVIGGELDPITPPQYVKDVTVYMPNSHKEVFKGIDHGVFSEKTCIQESVIQYLLSNDSSYQNKCE